LDQTLPSEDSSSIRSTDSGSEEEIISEQAAQELASAVNPLGEDGLAPQDAHLCEARRVFINKFASTLSHQDNPGVASPSNFSLESSANRLSDRSAEQPVASSSSARPSENVPHRLLEEDGNLLDNVQSIVTNQEHLNSVIDDFGPWTGTDSNGQVESESWIKQVPSILTRSVLVQGSMLLTNRRLCYVAYLPPVDTKDLIRVSTITFIYHLRLLRSCCARVPYFSDS
jgi:hypothetical protein